jgi:hypothetical protein
MTIAEYYRWLKRDWAKTGLILALFLFVFLMVFVKNDDFVLFLILLQTPLYMLHEAEEYIFPGGFGKFFNMDIFSLQIADKPLDENFIFFVNVSIIWIILPFFGLLSIRDYAWGLWIPYFSLFAGLAHVALALKARKRYNPGLIVSLFLNIPVGLWSILYLLNQHVIQHTFLNVYAAIGLGLNLVLPVMGAILYRNYMRKIQA